jgi:hypothetical protein
MLVLVNLIMGRFGFNDLPPETTRWLAETSKLVESRRVRLLTPPDGRDPFDAFFSKP